MVAKLRRESALEAMMAAQIAERELPEPIREFRFSPPRMWRADFAWMEPRRVLLEVEGGTWCRGRHSRGKGFEEDCLKYGEAALQGWLVLRVTGEMVRDERAIALLLRALNVAENV